MKIWTSPYELAHKSKAKKPRRGALLKVEWAIGQVGYSDLHPWPEFNEPELEQHIESLKKLQFTPLVENSLEFNYIDREYRLLKQNAFTGMILPRAHKLVSDVRKLALPTVQDWAKQGFSHLKIKIGTDLQAETDAFLKLARGTNVQWRLDFNGKLKEEEFVEWWERLEFVVKTRVDFIEDPIGQGELKISGPWANDWLKQKQGRIRIIKVAREPIEDLAQYDRIVFTHGMDHPFAQAYTLWAAGRFYSQHPKKTEVCGLAAPDFYEQNAFSSEWSCEGPRMKATTGTGFGFDQILESQSWQQVL